MSPAPVARRDAGDVALYLSSLTRLPHPVLAGIVADGRAAEAPPVDLLTGALLHGFATAIAATRVLEIGTGLGCSTLWLATALPPGALLVSLERDQQRATAARRHLAEAGLDDRVNVMIGEADRYLHKLAGPFDLIFQDGDTAHYGPMLDKLTALLRPGGVLVSNGILQHDDAETAEAVAIGAYNERLANDTRFTTTFLPVGAGVSIAVKARA